MGILEQLLTFENVFLCFAVVALVWVQRKALEITIVWAGKKLGNGWDITKSKLWLELLVPIGPLGTGAGIMLIPGVPIPEMFADGMPAKAIFGIGLGLISGLVYRLVKKMVFDRAGKSDENTPFVEE